MIGANWEEHLHLMETHCQRLMDTARNLSASAEEAETIARAIRLHALNAWMAVEQVKAEMAKAREGIIAGSSNAVHPNP